MRYICILGNVWAHFDLFYFLYVVDGHGGIMEFINLRMNFLLIFRFRCHHARGEGVVNLSSSNEYVKVLLCGA
jgi:hypothetical protein